MVRAAIQLYTLRNVEEPFTDLLERVAAAGFDGVEFAYRVTDEDPDTVRETLEETGLAVAGAHVPIESLEDGEETIAFYESLGCDDIVVPYLDEEFFSTADGIERATERLETIADELSTHDIALHYHNHHHEFVDFNSQTGFEAFLDACDREVGIELDLGLALLGGGDPVRLLAELTDRTPLVHLKDVSIEENESVPLGQGDLAIDRCADTVRANGEWLIYEYEGDDPLHSLDTAANTVRDLC